MSMHTTAFVQFSALLLPFLHFLDKLTRPRSIAVLAQISLHVILKIKIDKRRPFEDFARPVDRDRLQIPFNNSISYSCEKEPLENRRNAGQQVFCFEFGSGTNASNELRHCFPIKKVH